MSVQRTILKSGDGTNYPKPGDTITMEYTGWVQDTSKSDGKGKQFDSSVGRGDGTFKSKIGVGKLIQGWDKGVPEMSLGERAVLTIPPQMGYGAGGIPGLIPGGATLIFEVELKKIN